jgi:predicted nucleotidyltransferase
MDKGVLKFYRIYEKNNIDDLSGVFYKVMCKLKEIMTVEKLYLFGSFAYGHPHAESDYDFLVVTDVTPDEVVDIQNHITSIQYDEERKVQVVATTLKGFEKNCKLTTDLDFYVKEYGHLIFDSGKKSIYTFSVESAYSNCKDNLNFFLRYYNNNPKLMKRYISLLFKMYTVKKGYLPLQTDELLPNLKFAHYLNPDEMRPLMAELNEALTLNDTIKLKDFCDNLSRYVYDMKIIKSKN